MDTASIILEAKAKFNHQAAKLYLQEKYQNKLSIASQGGFWTITPELMTYLNSCSAYTILLDNYKNPIRVNSAELAQQARLVYDSVMLQWLDEWTSLERLR